MQWSLECRSYIVVCNSCLRWSAYSSRVLQLRVALVHVVRVVLVCVVLLCFATQGCAGLRSKDSARNVLDVSMLCVLHLHGRSAHCTGRFNAHEME